MKSLFLALTILLSSRAALAISVVIEDDRCVKADATSIHASITDYAAYSRLPGARYELDLIAKTVNLLTMTKSQVRYAERTAAKTNALVYLELQPTNLQDGTVYPRFFLECSSKGGAGAFDHACRILQTPEYASWKLNSSAPSPYGLQGFDSTLEIRGNDASCGSGKTRLRYRLILTGNTAQVGEIKAKVLEPASIFRKPLEALFNEDSFFKAYYENFYRGWISTL